MLGACEPDAAAPAVLVEDLEFSWTAAGPPVLAIDRFKLVPGERVFLAGPSGSGKSSLLSLIGGVAEAQRGTVQVLGTDLKALSRRQRDRFRADHVGFVFQLFNLVPYLTVLDNVALPCGFSRRRRQNAERAGGVNAEAMRLLEALNLDDRSLWHRQVTDLSIGQQQRVAAARALIGGPEVVIADEPTSALDEGTRESFLDLMFRECEAQAASLIFVSHDSRLGPLFDRALSLADVNHSSRGHGPA